MQNNITSPTIQTNNKSKLICYNIDPSTLGPICLNKQPISIVDNDKHLGYSISNDNPDRNIVSSVFDFYQRCNRYGLFDVGYGLVLKSTNSILIKIYSTLYKNCFHYISVICFKI